MKRYIIVGGVAAGATAAARLRRLDEEAEIILIERGPNVSYANCGLPYYIGGEIAARDALFVTTSKAIQDKYNVKVWENCEVKKIDKDAKTIEAEDLKTGEIKTAEYTKLLLATGSSPVVPPLPGIDGERVFTLWTVPDTDRIKAFLQEHKPKSVVVVGGGFIGLEMVENLINQGIEVDLVEMLPQVMAPLDPDMSKMIENHMIENGVRMHLGKGLKSIHDGGKKIMLDDGNMIDCDMVLLSIGVRPNNALAQSIGLEMSQRGHVITNDKMETSVPDIYAAGDLIQITDFVSGDKKSVPLAGPANKQGRIAADNMVLSSATEKDSDVFVENTLKKAKSTEYQNTQGTSVARVFELTSASTGHNEKTLKMRGLEYKKDYAYSLIHPQAHAGYFPGALPMCIKLIFSLEDGKVLGAQIVGYDGVDKRIDVIATAQRMGATIYDLTNLELAYAPPYSSAKDPVNMAGYAATNIYENLTDTCTWEEALNLPEDAKLLDIRENEEVIANPMENIQHIPLTELRDRLDEIDKDKTQVVFCTVGLRGYIAERLLKQHGFKVKNVLGGVRTYNTLYKEPKPSGCPIGLGATDDNSESDQSVAPADKEKLVLLNVCGLSCPGPIVEVAKRMDDLEAGKHLYVEATDPGFTRDIDSWCENTGHILVDKGKQGNTWFAEICKSEELPSPTQTSTIKNEKTMIVFSGELDKAIASFIIANGAAAMGNKVNMFFTFWGLNILRKPEKQKVEKDFMGKMFGSMMPRGSKKLGLSKMNFAGAGPKMIRSVMKKNNIQSIEDLIKEAQEAGVKMTACQMSMDVMGITKEELIDGVEIGGVATMLNDNDKSNMNLFI